MRALAIGAALLGATAYAAPAAPVYPANVQYFASGAVSLPFGNMTIPFSTYYDGANGRQSLSYYGGLNTYIYRSDINVTWQTSPEVNAMMCFVTNGSTSLTTLFPDTTGYTYLESSVMNGQKVDTFQLITNQGAKQAVYNFSVLSGTNTPVRASFIGRDLIIGSHTDQYIFDYYSVVFQPTFPDGTFNQPMSDCGNFPVPPGSDGSSVMQTEGNGLIRELLGMREPVHPTADKAYSAYLEQYGKSYADEGELRLRHARFTSNRRLIDESNRKHKVNKKTLRLAMNFLGDATEAELNLRMGRRADGTSHKKNGAAGPTSFANNDGPMHIHKAPADVSALPTNVSWVGTALEPVQDQGICGSCYIFAATGAIAGQFYLKYGRSIVVSKQEAVDCAWNFGVDGCGGGNDYLIYQWAMANGGIATRDQYGPYLSVNGFCKANSAGVTARLKGWVAVQNYSAPALMDAIANVGPISVSIDAAVPSFIFYSTGILDDPACLSDPADQDHSVIAAGYGQDDQGNQYWLIRNHWSTYWGDNGFVKIAMKDNDCGVTDAPTYPILV